MNLNLKAGDRVEINKNGQWITKGRITSLTTKGAYVKGLVGMEEETAIIFHEFFPFDSLRQRMVKCADQES